MTLETLPPDANARRDAGITAILSAFGASLPGGNAMLVLDKYLEGIEALKERANDPSTARLEAGDLKTVLSGVRALYGMLAVLATDQGSHMLSETQLLVGMRGIAGLVARWTQPEPSRFASTPFSIDADRMVEHFVASVRNMQGLVSLHRQRIDDQILQQKAIGDLTVAQVETLFLRWIVSPSNPLARDA